MKLKFILLAMSMILCCSSFKVNASDRDLDLSTMCYNSNQFEINKLLNLRISNNNIVIEDTMLSYDNISKQGHAIDIQQNSVIDTWFKKGNYYSCISGVDEDNNYISSGWVTHSDKSDEPSDVYIKELTDYEDTLSLLQEVCDKTVISRNMVDKGTYTVKDFKSAKHKVYIPNAKYSTSVAVNLLSNKEIEIQFDTNYSSNIYGVEGEKSTYIVTIKDTRIYIPQVVSSSSTTNNKRFIDIYNTIMR